EARLEEIERLGTRTVVSELYEDDRRWDAVRSGVASGAKAWLEVARRLKREAETSGPGQDLTEAVASALERAPGRVLAVLDGESFDSDDVCLPQHDRGLARLRLPRGPADRRAARAGGGVGGRARPGRAQAGLPRL